jgi:hypothetical protein
VLHVQVRVIDVLLTFLGTNFARFQIHHYAVFDDICIVCANKVQEGISSAVARAYMRAREKKWLGMENIEVSIYTIYR